MPREVQRKFVAPQTNAAVMMVLLMLLLAFMFVNLTGAVTDKSALQTAKQWKLFTYNFQPHAPVNDANFYNPSNVLATGIAIGYNRIFIATPKLFSGVSSTLNFVSKAEFGDSPVLQAYPDWSFSTTARKDFNCSDLVLISVYRIRIDSCNRLWVLDAGISRSLEDYEITCPPKILIIDLNTDQVVRRVDFPAEILRGESLFTNLIVDETTAKAGNCDDVYAYLSDTVEPGIIVYDSERDVTWRVSHPAMYPDPDFAQSEILNDRFILMDGIVGLTFDAQTGIVYFQPLATDRVFSVTKEVLRAGPLAQNEILQVKLVGKKSSQGIGLAVSPVDSSLLFSPLSETAIASWNPNTSRQSVLAYDRERLQFVADITTSPFEADVVYAVSSKFHRFFLKNLNKQEVNNRILRIQLPTATPSHGFEPIASNFAAYPFKAVATPLHFGHFHQSNTLEKTNAEHASQKPTNYFISSSDGVTSQHPYNYEPVGLINYSIRNPFTALNQGESFPPSREQRNNAVAHQSQKISFLDSLADGTIAPTVPSSSFSSSLPSPSYKHTHILHSGLPHLSSGYYFGREIRSIKAHEAIPQVTASSLVSPAS